MTAPASEAYGRFDRQTAQLQDKRTQIYKYLSSCPTGKSTQRAVYSKAVVYEYVKTCMRNVNKAQTYTFPLSLVNGHYSPQ